MYTLTECVIRVGHSAGPWPPYPGTDSLQIPKPCLIPSMMSVQLAALGGFAGESLLLLDSTRFRRDFPSSWTVKSCVD